MFRFFQIKFLVLSVFLLLGSAFAQSQTERPLDVEYARQAEVLKRDFQAAGKDGALLADLRAKADLLETEANKAAAGLQIQLDEANAELEKLGAGTDKTVSAPNAVDQRVKTLQAQLVSLNSTITIANQIISDISAVRRENFTTQILRRTPVTLESLSAGWQSYVSNSVQLRLLVKNWFVLNIQNKPVSFFVSIASGLLASLIIFLLFRYKFGPLLARNSLNTSPQLFAKFSIAFWKSIVPPVLVSSCLLTSYFAFDVFGMIGPTQARLFWLAIQIIIGLVFAWNLINAIFAPTRPNWRLVSLTSKGAYQLRFLMFLSALGYAFIYSSLQLAEIFSASVEFNIITGLIGAFIQCILLFVISRLQPVAAPKLIGEDNLNEDDEVISNKKTSTQTNSDNSVIERDAGDDIGRKWPLIIWLPMVLSAIIIIVSAVTGYAGLASFLSRQLVVTGAILVTMYLAYIASLELGREDVFANTSLGQWVARSTDMQPRNVEQLGLISGIVAIIAIVAVGFPLLAFQWGIQNADLWLFVRKVFFGVQIGGITLSLSGIFFGLLIFFAGYFITRVFQRWLDNGVMARSNLDTGVRDSIRKGVGYAGIGLVSFIAITAAGVNLSSLALVAGALSLGIGFGLQNIVSNFVSGLILLVERPIKVGDIITAAGYEGTVKQISVRATQLETFEKRTVTIPNSDLINGTVKNWTHQGRMSRYDIAVGVAYGTDTRLVESLLVDIARNHDKVINDPEPWVMFADFGASSLDFILYVYVADLSDGALVRTEMRHRIAEVLEEHGIGIPFPQRDVNLSITQTQLSDLPIGLGPSSQANPIKQKKNKRRKKPETINPDTIQEQ